jgi:hypothetical protein
MIFRSVAGSTTPTTRAFIGTGRPVIKEAALKKVIPLTKVPTAAVRPTIKELTSNFPSDFKRMNKTMQVTALSIILGSCPPGNVVVRADRSPANRAVMIKLSLSLLINSDKNMNISRKSNFIPPRNPGVIWCIISPMDNNNVVKIYFLSFINTSPLNSNFSNAQSISSVHNIIITSLI